MELEREDDGKLEDVKVLGGNVQGRTQEYCEGRRCGRYPPQPAAAEKPKAQGRSEPQPLTEALTGLEVEPWRITQEQEEDEDLKAFIIALENGERKVRELTNRSDADRALREFSDFKIIRSGMAC